MLTLMRSLARRESFRGRAVRFPHAHLPDYDYDYDYEEV